MKMKITLLEQAENFARESAHKLLDQLSQSGRGLPYLRDRAKAISLVDLFEEEDILVSNKIKKILGTGGMHIVAELSNGMILRLFFISRLGPTDPSLQAQISQNEQEYNSQFEKPDKMVVYSKGSNEHWAYNIVNKIFEYELAKPKVKRGLGKYPVYSSNSEEIEDFLPDSVMRILQNALSLYEDANEGKSHLTNQLGMSLVARNGEISEPQKIVRDERLNDRQKERKLLHYFQDNYWQFRELDPQEFAILKEFLAEYIKGSSAGFFDFKKDNLGRTSSGQYVWFDKTKRNDNDQRVLNLSKDRFEKVPYEPHKDESVVDRKDRFEDFGSPIQSTQDSTGSEEEQIKKQYVGSTLPQSLEPDLEGVQSRRAINEAIAALFNSVAKQRR